MNQFFDTQKQPPEAFCKKGCSWNFDKFHRKTPVLESLFDKVAGLNFIKKRLQRRCFPVKFAKIFQGRRGFVKLGHFDKCLSKTQVKKVLQRKILELFLLDTLKITFGRFKPRVDTITGPFFQNQGTFFDFQKSVGESSPFSALGALLLYCKLEIRWHQL